MRSTGGLLLSYVGDDFTGSTDVMEALALSGVRTVLFLDPPTREMIARFGDVRAVGIAGSSRTMSPGEMDAALPPTYHVLRDLGAPIVHYKVCSTFDSSPTIGSIGRALELGRAVFGREPVPVVIGAPILGRYVVFGNLFARSGLDTEPYRLDRHPTMRRHPITPMDEADIRVHLARQLGGRLDGEEAIALVDVLSFGQGAEVVRERWDTLRKRDIPAILFDTLDDDHLATIGTILWEEAERSAPLFVVGSSGVEYALTADWRKRNLASDASARYRAEPVDRVVVVSGSCSPVTARQIAHAVTVGYVEIALDTVALLDAVRATVEIERAAVDACAALERGRSVLLHTSRGPDDPRIAATRERFGALDVAKPLGDALGILLERIVERSGVTRAAVTGGDTSTYVARTLGIEAVETVAPLAPGSPLCRAYAGNETVDGLEVAFKGGQVGRTDWFESLQRGKA